MINIIGHKYIFLCISGLLVLASIVALLGWGLKLGIDLTGGTLMEINFSGNVPQISDIKEAVRKAGVESAIVQEGGERNILVRFGHIDEPGHQKVLAEIKAIAPEVREERFDTVGPTIGSELKKNSIIAVCLAIIGIVLYIAWAFRKVSKPVSSWKYGLATIVALVHDVIIPVGFFAVLGKLYGAEVDSLFITALLTILGFSVHDTIVVFDRIRENLRKQKSPEPLESVVNRSMNETMSRSINTSLTVILVLAATFFFGGETTRYFALALMVGIFAGTYSSIFIASPILVIWNQIGKRRG